MGLTGWRESGRELMVVGWEWENGSEDRAMLAARSKHVVLLIQEEFSAQTGMLTPSREHGTKSTHVAGGRGPNMVRTADPTVLWQGFQALGQDQ
jgi:hypothetical protein